jgi:opacity protein-like surface antigen
MTKLGVMMMIKSKTRWGMAVVAGALMAATAVPAAAQNPARSQHGSEGFYVSANVGARLGGEVNFQNGPTTMGVDTGTGVAGGGAVGYDWYIPAIGGTLQTEIEVNYAHINIDIADESFGFLRGTANFWYEFDSNSRVRPYIGGGVGIGKITGVSGLPPEIDGAGLAYQFGGGVRTNLSSDGRVYGGVGYRYRGFKKNIVSNLVTVGGTSHSVLVEVGVKLGR